MNFLYNTAIDAYKGAVKLAGIRNPKARLMIEARKTAIKPLKRGPWIWFHAASLGEFEQGRPMMEMIKKERPDLKILLTFFSPSGYEVRKHYEGVDVVAYLPFDQPREVKKFLDATHPDVAIFIKYEFWGNFLQQLKKRNIPTYLISGIFRPNQIFFRPYGGMMRKVLKCFNKIFVQNQDSVDLLTRIGVENVEVTGDTRFDRVAEIAAHPEQIKEIETVIPEPDIIFGSSWPQDEDLYIPWLKNNPDIKAIIAPHEFDNKRIASLKTKLGKDVTASYSELKPMISSNPEKLKDVKYIIMDCFGKLSSVYQYGKIAYIGGGFGAGIHNINEAAVYGIPVVFGPKHDKFLEAKALKNCGGGFAVNNAEEVSKTLTQLTQDTDFCRQAGEKAGDYVKSQLGATKKLFNQIIAPIEAVKGKK